MFGNSHDDDGRIKNLRPFEHVGDLDESRGCSKRDARGGFKTVLSMGNAAVSRVSCSFVHTNLFGL